MTNVCLMKIVNIVATVEMEKPFDLEEILSKLPNVERAHHWVKAKIPPYNKYTAFYGSGKFLVTGVKSHDELNQVANNVVNFLKEKIEFSIFSNDLTPVIFILPLLNNMKVILSSSL